MSEQFDLLRNQFEANRTTGIDQCEDVVKTCGGSIYHFQIEVAKDDWNELEELREAIDFLVFNWGYKLILR